MCTDIPQLTGPLSVSSTTTDRITVSWTAPELPPTGYIPTSICTLICSDSLLTEDPIISITNSSSTSVTFSSIPPGSKCNITLAAQYGSSVTNKLMVIATTLSESEQTITVDACMNYLLFLCTIYIYIVNRTIGSTHWLCCVVSEQLIRHLDMERSSVH